MQTFVRNTLGWNATITGLCFSVLGFKGLFDPLAWFAGAGEARKTRHGKLNGGEVSET